MLYFSAGVTSSMTLSLNDMTTSIPASETSELFSSAEYDEMVADAVVAVTKVW